MKVKSNIKLFDTEKEAQAFIDTHFKFSSYAHEINLSEGGILWTICIYDANDEDLDLFVDEYGEYVIRTQVIIEEVEE